MARAALEIAGESVTAGARASIALELPKLNSHSQLAMPLHVVHGRRPGPTLFVSAAVHGDELNGIEIVRRLLLSPALGRLRGTLLAVPVVNPYGLIHESRYLPDRRDLNRSFPGSDGGSMAARIARLFMDEVVAHCDYGIDLHTGAVNRSNLPQVRANLADEEVARLATAFGVPVVLNSALRDGSLRAAAGEQGIRLLLYEAGEALRLDEVSIRAGTRGVLNVMRALGMLPASRRAKLREPYVAYSSRWTRAPESGLYSAGKPLGAYVNAGDVLGHVHDPHSGRRIEVPAANTGLVIGRLESALEHEGDALFHIARFDDDDLEDVADGVESFQTEFGDGEGD